MTRRPLDTPLIRCNTHSTSMKQFAEVFRKLMTPVAARGDAQWLKKAAACPHAFYRCTAIMAGSWARNGGMVRA